MSEATKKAGRPRKAATSGPGDSRTPPRGISEAFLPLGSGFFGGNADAERLLTFHALKADPSCSIPEIQAEFGRVIAGFPDEVFTDESVLLLMNSKKLKTSKLSQTEEESLRSLADGIEAKRQRSRDFVGALMACAVEHFTADQAAEFFNHIVKMKLTHGGLPHRNAWAHAAYGDFINETGKEPSKPHLRKYMEARKEKYRDQPSPDDKKGWSRLWKDSGLFTLSDR
jgi:hypothetical protein